MSLVEITKDARIFLKVGGIVCVSAFLIFLLFKGGQFVQSTFFPKPLPPAEKKFGEIPAIEFPQSNVPLPEFSIETVSGFLPTFPITISVYELMRNEPTITALPEARVRAGNAGFTENEQAISQSEYRWTRPTGGFLLYDIYSLNFSISPDYTAETSTIGENRKNQIDSTYTNFITTLGGNTEDIDTENSKYSYYNLVNGGIIPTDEAATANLIRIDLFQKNVNDFKIYYPTVNNSLLFFTVSNTNRGLTINESSYHHFIPNLSSSSTYDIKTAQEAYDELVKGGGYIVQPTTDKKVGINKVELGYYLSDSEDQKYLLPVIVFKGLNDFQAYVSAIKN